MGLLTTTDLANNAALANNARTPRRNTLIGGFFLLLLALGASACGNVDLEWDITGDDVEGSGVLETRTFDLVDFDRVDLSAGFEGQIIIDPDAEPTVSIEMDDNFFEFLQVEIRNSTLVIDPDRVRFKSEQEPVATLTMPTLEAVDLSGGSTATVTGLAAIDFVADLSGGSQLTVSGTATTVDLDGSGGSVFWMDRLNAERVSIDLSGGSDLGISASEAISGSASGGSEVFLLGDADSSVSLSGGSTVERR